MGFFSGSKEEVASLGGLVGIDTANIKGLGLKSGSFDAEITSEDGKIDIACGSGGAPIRDRQTVVYRLLMGLMYSRRFDRLFSEADTSGNFTTRPEVARAIIDWADADDQMFTLEGAAAVPRTTGTTRAPIAIARTTTATTASRRSRWCAASPTVSWRHSRPT